MNLPLPIISLAAATLALYTLPAAAQAPQAQVQDYLQLKRDMVIIHSLAEFNNHIESLALSGKPSTNCLFVGNLKGKEKETLQRSLWFNYADSVTITTHPDSSVVFTFTYKDNALMLAAHRNPALRAHLTTEQQQALAVARQRVQELITPQMSTLEKVRALHDDLVNRATYDLPSGGSCTTMLLHNRGVCEAYSRALWLMLRMAGIPCLIVAGHTDEPHAWNLVQVDGEWYHVDSTWDDPTIIGSNRNVLSHHYFLVTDAQLAKDHSWQRDSIPVSAVKDALYFRTNKAYFTNYGQFWPAVAAAIDSGATEYEAYLTAYGDKSAFERSLLQNIPHIPALAAVKSWSGPQSGGGVVRLTFNHSGTPTRATEEVLQVTRAAVEKARDWVENGGLTDWADNIDLSPIEQELDHLWQEATRQLRETGQQLEEAADKALQSAEQRATEWWNSATEEVESWF